jgi:asparagine synthase (glutamine-hydrolysing)
MLSESCLKKVGLFNQNKVGRLVAKFRKADLAVESEVQNMALVGILTTQIVHHQFIENFPWKPIEPIKLDKIIRKN